jgi:hypothetical protein
VAALTRRYGVTELIAEPARRGDIRGPVRLAWTYGMTEKEHEIDDALQVVAKGLGRRGDIDSLVQMLFLPRYSLVLIEDRPGTAGLIGLGPRAEAAIPVAVKNHDENAKRVPRPCSSQLANGTWPWEHTTTSESLSRRLCSRPPHEGLLGTGQDRAKRRTS